MKFLKHLLQALNAFPLEWRRKVIDYKFIKKAISSDILSKSLQPSSSAAFSLFELELKKVCDFHEIIVNELKSYLAENDTTNPDQIKKIEAMATMILEFTALNLTGFYKALKKQSKKMKQLFIEEIIQSPLKENSDFRTKLQNSSLATSRDVDKIILKLQAIRNTEEPNIDFSIYGSANSNPEYSDSKLLYPFLGGALLGQIPENVNKLVMPLIFLKLSSIVMMGLITSIATGLDSFGTLIGGYFCDKFSSRSVLTFGTFIRIITLAMTIITWYLGEDWGKNSSLLWIISILYFLDTIIRGILDVGRSVYPIDVHGFNEKKLNHINVRYQALFESGALIGPLAAAFILDNENGLQYCLLLMTIPVVFTLFFYMHLPIIPVLSKSFAVAGLEKKNKNAGLCNRFLSIFKEFWGSLQDLWNTPNITLLITEGMLIQTHRIRTTIPQILAVTLWKNDSYSAWIYGMFAVGAIPGNMIQSYFKTTLLKASFFYAFTTFILSICWLPAYWMDTISFTWSFSSIMLGVTIFSVFSNQIRTSLQTELQTSLSTANNPASLLGLNRTAANIMGSLIKFYISLLWIISSDDNRIGFTLLSGSLIATAIATVIIAFVIYNRMKQNRYSEMVDENHIEKKKNKRKERSESPSDGFLIVFEGLDGSGKSTQVDLLKGHLIGLGYQVWMTAWCRPLMHRELVRTLKKEKPIRIILLTIVQAMEFRLLVENHIKKRMQKNMVVICDRYNYTGIARGVARGLHPRFLWSIFSVPLVFLSLTVKAREKN